MNERFKDHKVISYELYGYSKGKPTIEHLVWGKPGTSVDRIYYMLHRQNGLLCVYGDLYEATYQWYGPRVTLKWISGCNLDYFHSKCKASDKGAAYKNYEWDEIEARKTIFQYFKNNMDCKGYKKFKESFLQTLLDNKEEFIAEMYNSSAHEIFGNDYWEWLYSCGDVIPWITRAHLEGLKMAVNELRRQVNDSHDKVSE